MRFLRSVADYRRRGTGRNINIRQDLNIYNSGENVKDHQNCSESILRIPTNLIPLKLFEAGGRSASKQMEEFVQPEDLNTPKDLNLKVNIDGYAICIGDKTNCQISRQPRSINTVIVFFPFQC